MRTAGLQRPAKVAQLDWAYPVRPPSGPAAAGGEQSGDLTQRRAAVTAPTRPAQGLAAWAR